MTSWFLECQIDGVKNKIQAILSDWESLDRSIVDSERNDYVAMLNTLLKAQLLIERDANKITGDDDNDD